MPMSETIGKLLKEARESRQLAIEKVVQATRIRAHYIESMEADDFEIFPSPAQARGFLRTYAGYLGLSLNDLAVEIQAGLAAPTGDTPLSASLVPAAGEAPAGTEVYPPHKPLVEAAGPIEPGRPAESLLKKIQKLLSVRLHPSRKPAEGTAVTADSTTAKEGLSQRRNIRIRLPWKKAAADDLHKPAAVGETASAPQAEVVTSPPVEGQSPALLQSKVIYISIGEHLRERRELLGLTLEEVERQTRIRRQYLQSLEAGQFDDLSSPVHTRGALNSYAQFLNMDVDAVLLRFAEGLQAHRQEKQPRPAQVTKPARFRLPFILPPSLQRYLSTDMLIGGGLILLLLIIAIWGTSRVIALRKAPAAQGTAPSISDILLSTTTTAETISAATLGGPLATTGGSAVPFTTAPATGGGRVQLILLAIQRTTVRVTIDGQVKFEGQVLPGTAYPFDGNQQIEVLTGNGAALQVIYQQMDQGVMGSLGEVVDRIYTADAILNPTATPSPTPTVSPLPSATLKPSSTPRTATSPSPTP